MVAMIDASGTLRKTAKGSAVLFTLAYDKSSLRRVDAFGKLHVEKSHISKAVVNDYLGYEIPAYQSLGLDADKIYGVFRPPEELEKAAKSFDNIQILLEHDRVTAGEPKHEKVIGSTGTDAEFDGEYLNNSLVFWDQEFIDKINDDEQRELSCSYKTVLAVRRR